MNVYVYILHIIITSVVKHFILHFTENIFILNKVVKKDKPLTIFRYNSFKYQWFTEYVVT